MRETDKAVHSRKLRGIINNLGRKKRRKEGIEGGMEGGRKEEKLPTKNILTRKTVLQN